jgi:hypothetical protein
VHLHAEQRSEQGANTNTNPTLLQSARGGAATQQQEIVSLARVAVVAQTMMIPKSCELHYGSELQSKVPDHGFRPQTGEHSRRYHLTGMGVGVDQRCGSPLFRRFFTNIVVAF